MKDLEVWEFVLDQFEAHQKLALLVVAQSSGSSPGRQGFKMAVTANGEMKGSIGGGIMENKLIDMAITQLKEDRLNPSMFRQIHRDDEPADRSGMICSGEQTVLVLPLKENDQPTVAEMMGTVQANKTGVLSISSAGFSFGKGGSVSDIYLFEAQDDDNWNYGESVGYSHCAYIIGGGHVGLAMSKMLASLDFYVKIIDNREGLNTMEMNQYAHQKIIIPYEDIDGVVEEGSQNFVIIMTVGYRTDEVVIRKLIKKKFGFIGMMGSKSKTDQLFGNLRKDGFNEDHISRVQAPIGIEIKSQTPEEIAVSIAAQLIRQRNADKP